MDKQTIFLAEEKYIELYHDAVAELRARHIVEELKDMPIEDILADQDFFLTMFRRMPDDVRLRDDRLRLVYDGEEYDMYETIRLILTRTDDRQVEKEIRKNTIYYACNRDKIQDLYWRNHDVRYKGKSEIPYEQRVILHRTDRLELLYKILKIQVGYYQELLQQRTNYLDAVRLSYSEDEFTELHDFVEELYDAANAILLNEGWNLPSLEFENKARHTVFEQMIDDIYSDYNDVDF
jgi:hypothetical protein